MSAVLVVLPGVGWTGASIGGGADDLAWPLGTATDRPACAAHAVLDALAGETGIAFPLARLSARCEGLSARCAVAVG